MSNCLGCWKEELQNKLRAEDKLLIKNIDEEEELLPHFETERHFNHLDLDLEGKVVYSTSTIEEKEEIATEPEEEEWYDDLAYELYLEYLKYRQEALDSITDEELEYADWDDYSDYTPEEETEWIPEDFDWEAFEKAGKTVSKRDYCPPICAFVDTEAKIGEYPEGLPQLLVMLFIIWGLPLLWLLLHLC